MVDAAIDAMTGWMRSGRTANEGGAFPHARASAGVVEEARAAVARLLGADAAGVAFGPSMTAMTMPSRPPRRGPGPATRSSAPASTTTRTCARG